MKKLLIISVLFIILSVFFISPAQAQNNSADVALIWEAVSYTPPFYKGKALNPNQGTVVVVAIPEISTETGQKIKTSDLNYRWYKNDILQNSSSGVGKNHFTFSGSVPIRDITIKVIISTLDQKVTIEKSVTITNVPPKIIFYENSPIYGLVFNRAIKNSVKMMADEFGIKAFPYFMSIDEAQNANLDYTWTINNRASSGLDTDKTAMLFRQEIAGSGTTNVNLKIQNNSRIFQFTDNSFIINFEKQ